MNLETMTLAQLRKEYNQTAREMYAYGHPGAQAKLDALKAEAERRGKMIRPGKKVL